jgi:hypothetical protein
LRRSGSPQRSDSFGTGAEDSLRERTTGVVISAFDDIEQRDRVGRRHR